MEPAVSQLLPNPAAIHHGLLLGPAEEPSEQSERQTLEARVGVD